MVFPTLDKEQGTLGKPQKSYFFKGPATKMGGGKGLATKKKELFWNLEKKHFLQKMWSLSTI